MFLKFGIADADRSGIDNDLDAAGARTAVELDLAPGLVELPVVRRIAEVADLEAGKRVARIDDIGVECQRHLSPNIEELPENWPQGLRALSDPG